MKNSILVRHPHLLVILCYPLQHAVCPLPLPKKFVIVSRQKDKYLIIWLYFGWFRVAIEFGKAGSASSVHSHLPVVGKDPTRIDKLSLCPLFHVILSRFPSWASMVLSLSFHGTAQRVKIPYLLAVLPYRRIALLDDTCPGLSWQRRHKIRFMVPFHLSTRPLHIGWYGVVISCLTETND